MTINIRTKGAEGEREVARVLNKIICEVLAHYNLPEPDCDVVQRNQNQTAVGGNDLSNVFGISIEVKRQEQLSVNTWWAQCLEDARRNDEFPVLLFRQNRKRWRCMLYSFLLLPSKEVKNETRPGQYVRCEIDWEDFQIWFREWVMCKVAAGDRPVT